MLSTATALIEATHEAVFDDESMDFARELLHSRNEMSNEQFAKAIYLYAGTIASMAVDKATKVLLTKEQIIDLMVTIGEMESLRNEVLNG